MYLYAMYVYLAPCYKTAFLCPSIRVLMYTLHVCVLSTSSTYTMNREEYAYTHARPVERYVSSDRTTVAREPGQASRNASPFLSPITLFRLFSYPSLFFPFLFSFFFFFSFFFLVATLTQRGKNSRGYAEDSHRDPCFRRSCFERACTPCRFSSLRLFVRPIALFTALPGQSQVRKSRLRRNARAGGGESSLLAAAPLAVLRPSIARSRSAVRYVLPFPSATTRKRTSDANQSKLFYRQEDLIYNNIFLQRTSFRRSRISSLNWIYWFY